MPNLRTKGDRQDNFELISDPIEEGKFAPDVFIDFGKAAKACGIGERDFRGAVLTDEFGPFERHNFILTRQLLNLTKKDNAFVRRVQKCARACPGGAIDESGKTDLWQCAVYYNGACGLKNPFMGQDTFAKFDNRLGIISREAKVTGESARKILDNIYFYPPIQHSNPCSVCGRACNVACYVYLEENDLLKRRFNSPFRERETWEFKIEDFENKKRGFSPSLIVNSFFCFDYFAR